MGLQRLDHIGVVVEDLEAAITFFTELGLVSEAQWTADDPAVGRIIGLQGVRAACAMLAAPDGSSRLEIVRFDAPPAVDGDPQGPSHATGLRHLCFEVDDVRDTVARLEAHGAELVGELVEFGGSYTLCYIRGPEGIILELAEKVG
jgi:catechol 2,3-dioxygenase-like lactoylglutathione lyase family enzyme